METIARAAVLFVLFWAALLPAGAQDFGDAPDGTPRGYGGPGALGGFPTSSPTVNSRIPGNVGIHHTALSTVWLGPAGSVTTAEALPNLTDLDVDDSGAFFLVELSQIPAPALMQVPVSIAAGAPPGPYYLNVLVDRNNDGTWTDGPALREWVVRDRPISQASGTTMVHSIAIPWSSGLFLLPKWVRMSVTSVPVGPAVPWGASGWDGSMAPLVPFAIGETEDRFVGGVYPGTAGQGGGPLPGPAGGGNPGGIGGGAFGKGAVGPGANPAGACMMDIECGPKELVVPCGQSRTVTCRVKFLSGECPELPGLPGCNAQVDLSFLRHLGAPGPLAVVAPNPQCGWVGPGSREIVFSYAVSFPPPCNPPNANPRRQRWKFACLHDPDGVYGEVGPDEAEGMVVTLAPPGCGNGVPEPPFEACDDGNLFYRDACTGDCRLPGYAPNGALGPGEQCDDGNAVAGDGCGPSGLREYCGNLFVDPHEGCDDGNTVDGDGCSRHCELQSAGTCGNGSLDHVLEQCDDGNFLDGDGCDANCQLETCGDGSVDLGEQCDDGNVMAGDGCGSTCLSEGACGNGWIDVGEACDDGNLLDGDGCEGCERVALHVEGLVFDDAVTLRWQPALATLRSYDVLRGELATLSSVGGNHASASSVCLARASRVESVADADTPAAGEVYYYMVRVARPWTPTQTTYAPAPPAPGYAGGRDAAAACD